MIRDSEHGSGWVRTGGVSRVIRDSEHGSGWVRTGGDSRVIRDKPTNRERLTGSASLDTQSPSQAHKQQSSCSYALQSYRLYYK